MSVRPITTALLTVGAVAFFGATGARADIPTSNWSGYAVHRPGVRFREVSAAWRQPSASCVRGRRAYAAFWVGLGGFRKGARSLEQVGTETDCTAGGHRRAFVWYEVVPAATRSVRLPISPGDTIAAAVSAHGRTVTFALADFSNRRTFRRTVHAGRIDLSSAEWIVEAPSGCVGHSHCQILPLANFGSMTFSHASARSASGHTGTIPDPAWFASRFVLNPFGKQFAAAPGTRRASTATTSGLKTGGSSFRVTFSQLATHAAVQVAQAISIVH